MADSLCMPDIRAWWDHVTVTPEPSKTNVFKKGTSKALKGIMPIGGQLFPISTEGANLLWKNAQKNLKKKKISEIINKAIPQRRPSSTIEEWIPCNAPSLAISLHHWKLIRIKEVKLAAAKRKDFSWNHMVNPRVRFKAAVAERRGQGDSSTKW